MRVTSNTYIPTVAASVNIGPSIQITNLTCQPTDAIGYPVKIVGNNEVTKMSNNTTDDLYGIIVSKSSGTNCTVCTGGRADNMSGLTAGVDYYLNTDGTLTATRPTSGFIQIVGRALSDTCLNLMIGTSVGESMSVSNLTCGAGDNIGDPVKITGSYTVSKMVNNTTDEFYGIIVGKQSATICTVTTYGDVVNLSGLSIGVRYFIQTNGTLGTTRPTTGYLQRIGRAISSTVLTYDKSERIFLAP